MTPGAFDKLELRPVKMPDGSPFDAVGLAVGKGSQGVEVLVAKSTTTPRLPNVRSTWKARNAGRAAPLMLVVLHDGKATVCGPAGDDPPAYPAADIGQVERICREALEQPDRHAALRSLRDALPSVESPLPGIRNEGFLATHELAAGVKRTTRWERAWAIADKKARPLLAQKGDGLLRSLGFQIEPCDQVTAVLRAGPNGKKVAVAVLLHQSESPELQGERFSGLSPTSYALAVADRENVPYVIVSHGSKLRLYPVQVGVGVGRRGRTETYVEIHTGLLRDTDAAYLWLLFSAEALVEGGSLEQLIDESRRFAGDLAERLRERIYGEVVPQLAEGIAKARGMKKPTASDLSQTYEMAMTVLFRLLFIAYAEDKDLLPYRWNGLYRSRSLKTKAAELLEIMNARTPFDDGDSQWEEVKRLFRAVEKGNREWGVPEYDGGLFSTDAEVSPVGALLDKVALTNRVMGPVLQGLLIIQTPEGWGPVDFRSLGVREFGTVYEGLLESELAVAETDLTVDKNGFYRPCLAGEEPIVKKQRIYLHNRSGARKSTGSYFTKSFAVEHLLDRALEPALVEHLERVTAIADNDEAAETFFDFRVADIAMGSGHFLVAAVDRIERAFTQYLSTRPLSGVRHELAKLRASATEALGTLSEQVEIEDTQLLRRLIARRCIYGVDINPVAVDLARLSIWVHTFVPGLPLSLLDHNLITGNSLVGIAQVSEIEDKAKADDLPLFSIDTLKLVGEAVEPLQRLARIADATAVEVNKARKAMEEAKESIRAAEALCDIVTACRVSGSRLMVDLAKWDSVKEHLPQSKYYRDARNTIGSLTPLHFPVAFPEVFLRDRKGFDVILGNPPWDKVRFEAQQFWVARAPGLNGLPASQREKAIDTLRKDRPLDARIESAELHLREQLQSYIDKAFHLQGRGRHGHHDLAKVFSERSLRLLASDGHLGYVLPRTSLVLGGWADIRKELLQGQYVGTLQARNRAGWLFDDIHYQLMVVLLSLSRTPNKRAEAGVAIWPSVTSVPTLLAATDDSAIRLTEKEIETLTDSWVVPWFSGPRDRDIFDCMRTRPRLGLKSGWITAVADSSRWDFSGSGPHEQFTRTADPNRGWRVLMTRHVDAYRISEEDGFQRFIPDPSQLVPLALGVVSRNRKPVLHGEHPVIIYRYPTMNDNTRTLIATALPEAGYLYSKGYVHGLRTPGAESREVLALLGYLNTAVCDWWVRRFTDRHMTLPVLRHVPLPDWNENEREIVASHVASLLLSGGVRVLPGPVDLSSIAAPTSDNGDRILAKIELAALSGFGLTVAHFASVREDFSDGAFGEGFLRALGEQR